MTLLDKKQVQRAFSRFALTDNDLTKIAAERLFDRVADMKLQPTTVVDIGGNGQYIAQQYPTSTTIAIDFALAVLQQRTTAHCCLADVQNLPLATASADIVWSNLCMEWVDIHATITEAARILKPNGLLALTTLGPDTLKEIKSLFPNQNRVHSFVDMHLLSDALVVNGFVEPIAEADPIELSYSTAARAMMDCKQIGAACALRDRARGLMGKTQWQQALNNYPKTTINGKNYAVSTFELICITAWRKDKTSDYAPIDFY